MDDNHFTPYILQMKDAAICPTLPPPPPPPTPQLYSPEIFVKTVFFHQNMKKKIIL